MIRDDDDPFEHEDTAEVIDLDPARRRQPSQPDIAGTDVAASQDEGDDEDEAWDDDGDDGDDGERMLVDSPEAQRDGPRLTPKGVRAATRRPIIPPWARSWAAFTDHIAWWATYWAYALGYHATRSPKYAARLLVRAPVGAARVLTRLARWAFDAEGHPARVAMVGAATVRVEEAHAYLRLSTQRDQRVRVRTTIATLMLLGTAGGGVALWWYGTARTHWATLGAAIVGFGLAGAPADKPLLDTPVAVARPFRLTSDVVARALGVLGIAQLDVLAKDPRSIRDLFPEPIRQDGAGWRAVINLPHGTTATEVIKRRDRLASGLDRPLGCVWPEATHEISPRRLVLYVAEQDMATVKHPFPLAKHGTVDLFEPFPFGTDPRGRAVSLRLMEQNLLIGSMPGYGKTFAVATVLLAAALDARAELWVFDFKGAGDLSFLKPIAHRYATGFTDDKLALGLQALRDLWAECERRTATIDRLPDELTPESKVTPTLAGRKPLKLHPIVAAFDEVHNLFGHPEFGEEAKELATKVIKTARALAIQLVLATQRPDAPSLPTGVSSNAGIRFCLRVMGHRENDMILGTSMHANGVRATALTERDKGIGYLVGAAPEPRLVKTFHLDKQLCARIIARARPAREAAGMIGGWAAGEIPQPPTRRPDTLLRDLLGVFPAGEDKAACETLASLLAQAHPEVYGDLSAEQLGASLRGVGVNTSVQVNRFDDDGRRRNLRGVTRQSLLDAATQRGRNRRAEP
jgi:S-DNA-T family DNA segregation ATPase FtsK/SpoIIIE